MSKSIIGKIVGVCIIISSFIIAFSVAYYLVIFLRKREKNRIDLQKQTEAAALEKQKLDDEITRKEAEIRSQARIDCSNYAKEKVRAKEYNVDDATNAYNILYESCFREKGMNP